MYFREVIEGGYRYYWVRCEEVRQWLTASGIVFDDYPKERRYVHDVYDAKTAVLIKLA